jgi:hypothetical protein
LILIGLQHYWAIHDTRLSRTLRPFSTRLEALREREASYFDSGILYTAILDILKDINGSSTLSEHHICGHLSKCLFRSGTTYYDYAAVFAEQGLIHGNDIEHAYRCDLCVHVLGPSIRGPRFVCLDCIDGDLCADCYASWEKSNGEMEFCKGHTFYEIPRRCWYNFREGVVMEDGSTLPQVIDFLIGRFTTLLENAGSQTGI